MHRRQKQRATMMAFQISCTSSHQPFTPAMRVSPTHCRTLVEALFGIGPSSAIVREQDATLNAAEPMTHSVRNWSGALHHSDWDRGLGFAARALSRIVMLSTRLPCLARCVKNHEMHNFGPRAGIRGRHSPHKS
jgi:hypothetical protein